MKLRRKREIWIKFKKIFLTKKKRGRKKSSIATKKNIYICISNYLKFSKCFIIIFFHSFSFLSFSLSFFLFFLFYIPFTMNINESICTVWWYMYFISLTLISFLISLTSKTFFHFNFSFSFNSFPIYSYSTLSSSHHHNRTIN